MEKVAEWDREFRIWHYTVSYSQLLLRSINVEGSETRIDVLFSNVSMMNLPSSLEHLRIDRLEPSDPQARAHEGVHQNRETSVYLLSGGEFYIYATHCEWHEDLGGTRTPSKFGPLRGVE